MKDILIGKADIKALLEKNFIYVDKTEYIYNLIRIPDIYFLSRPRRFGKSLLVSTLKEIFLGNKELFKDCWIYKNTNYDWKSYPIIHLDFAETPNKEENIFKQELINNLTSIARFYELELISSNEIKPLIKDLLIKLYEKYNEKVVILVDEYDKPLLDNIDNLDVAKANRECMKDLYTIMKSNTQYIHFQFVTGITKFSKTSLFSGPNNLYDISMLEKYNNLLGYTQNELEFYFSEYINLTNEKFKNFNKNELLNEIKKWFNGYIFTEEYDLVETVYNPFSILNFFSNKKFLNYWFSSATPSYLMALLNKYFYEVPEDENNIYLTMYELEKFEIDKINLISLLFQAGYLTIESYNTEEAELKLKYPNNEVRNSFNKQIQEIIILKKNFRKIAFDLQEYLKGQNWEKLFELFKSFYAAIPYTETRNESWYSTIFFQAFQTNGFRCEMEGLTNVGRTDMVLYFDDIIYIIEFKYNKTAQEALSQIEKNLYFEKYLKENSPIAFIGINFSELKRNINDWKVKEYLK